MCLLGHKTKKMTEELNISEEPQHVEENQQPIEDNQPEQQEEPKTEEIVVEETIIEVLEPLAESQEEKTEETQTEETQTEEIQTEETQTEETQTEEQPKSEKKRKPFIEAQPQIVPNTDDFNWDELGKDTQIYSETEKKQLEDIYNQTFNAIVEQEVVEGTIVAKNTREVVVNIGFKSDGVIPANELRYLENLKIGDKVEVYVESQEDASGQLLLSHKKARLLKSWERVNLAQIGRAHV